MHQDPFWPPSESFQPILTHQFALPDFTIATMTNYFISRVTCDGRLANDVKSLNSKAFPLFKDAVRGDKCYFKSVCLPEMKKNITYTIQLSVDIKSNYTKCGCPAGSGPFGSCKHIAAMCYAVEEFRRVKCVRDHPSCTSRLQEWNKPRNASWMQPKFAVLSSRSMSMGKRSACCIHVYDPQNPVKSKLCE